VRVVRERERWGVEGGGHTQRKKEGEREKREIDRQTETDTERNIFTEN